MADVVISDLPELTGLTLDDYVIVNDGDVTTTKVSFANVVASITNVDTIGFGDGTQSSPCCHHLPVTPTLVSTAQHLMSGQYQLMVLSVLLLMLLVILVSEIQLQVPGTLVLTTLLLVRQPATMVLLLRRLILVLVTLRSQMEQLVMNYLLVDLDTTTTPTICQCGRTPKRRCALT